MEEEEGGGRRTRGQIDLARCSPRYHDMDGMLDFLILDSVYKTSVRRQWQPDDRFCSLIDNAYWHGKVISREPFRYVRTSSNAEPG